MVICLERGADCLHMVCIYAVPMPHNLFPHLNPARFYLSGTGLPRLSWQRGHLMFRRGPGFFQPQCSYHLTLPDEVETKDANSFLIC